MAAGYHLNLPSTCLYIRKVIHSQTCSLLSFWWFSVYPSHEIQYQTASLMAEVCHNVSSTHHRRDVFHCFSMYRRRCRLGQLMASWLMASGVVV